ncbi:MAG: hypothetical protein AAGD43_07230 [Pseudomonadota bacterium]
MTTIILIHGINNHDNSREDIERNWSMALREGLAKIGVSLPGNAGFRTVYYAEVLKERADTWGAASDAATPMSATSPASDLINRDIARIYLEYQRAYGITDEQVRQELPPEDDQDFVALADGIHKSWIKALARVLERIVPIAAKPAASLFLGQAAAYLHRPGTKEQIDDLVLAQAFDNWPGDDTIIVSHSLGTVIAYDLLRRLRHSHRCKLLLTCGSPLGIDIVRDRLGPPLSCLPNVVEWINVSDPEDFVALRTSLNATTFGCDEVVNHADVDNGDADAHDIREYLKHRPVAKALARTIPT